MSDLIILDDEDASGSDIEPSAVDNAYLDETLTYEVPRTSIEPAGNDSSVVATESTRRSRRSARPVKRGRDGVLKKTPTVPSPKRVNVDLNDTSPENDSGCIICLEPFENYGKHRISSLKCGHVFGESCIYKWLEQSGMSKCPQCNSVAKKREIRTIFCSKLMALDVAERNKAVESFEQEKSHRMRLESEVKDLKVKNSLLSAEIEVLKNRLAQEQTQLRQSTEITMFRNKLYRSFSQLALCSKGGSRRIVFDPVQKVLVTSQAMDFLSMNRGHGLRKISALNFKSSKMIKCHKDTVRTIAAYDSKVLSGGSDKKLSLTCLKSDVVIQEWSSPDAMNIWACEFNKKNPNLLYVGCQNGSLLTYDCRVLTAPVSIFTSHESRVPVTSLNFVSFESSNSFNAEGILIGGFDGCKFYELNQSNVDPVVHVLGNELKGNCTSLSYDVKSNHILASFRPSLHVKNVRHCLSRLQSLNFGSEQIKATKVHEFYGGSSMKQLTRSCVYSAPTGKNDQLFVSAFDQSSEQLITWESFDGSKFQTTKMKDFICLDLCPFEINNEHFFAALSDSALKILKFS